MLLFQKLCAYFMMVWGWEKTNWSRFLNYMKWRKEFGGGLDELVQNFRYDEKVEVFKYYPQYYHKTDKVHFTP